MKFLVLILAVALAGCCNHKEAAQEAKGSESKRGSITYAGEDKLYVFEDPEKGITCYQTTYYNLSCLKTKPSAKEEMENKMIQEIFKGE